MFVTEAEIKKRTSFPEVSSLSDFSGYMSRADRWIFRATGIDYSAETDPGIQQDLKTATIHLIDLLWFQDQADVKETQISGFDSEKIGSYSYSKMKKALPGEETGIPELDSILDALKLNVQSVNFFSVGGPSS